MDKGLRLLLIALFLVLVRAARVPAQTAEADVRASVQHAEDLAQAYRAAGRAAEAEPLQRRVLAMAEKTLGADDPAVVATMTSLGNTYVDLGRYPEAERLYGRALEIDERTLGPVHPDVGVLLSNLAVIDRLLGRSAQGETRGRRARAILEVAPGPVRPELAQQIGNLGDLALVQGHLAEAESLYQQAIAAMTKAVGPDSPEIARGPLNGLAVALTLQGKHAEAESTYRRALGVLQRVPGPPNGDVAQMLSNLGQLDELMGRFAEADAMLERGLQIKEAVLAPDHPDVALTLGILAGLRTLEGRYPEADVLFRRALAIQEKALGQEHPAVATTLNNLAGLLRAEGRPSEAEPLLTRAVSIQEKAYGGDHAELATTLNNLYLAEAEQGEAAQAEPLLRRALGMTERTLGREHANVARPLINLAMLYASEGRLAEGEALAARALAIREEALGSQHPDVAVALADLSVFAQLGGRYDESEALLRRALEVDERALGPRHEQVAFLSFGLGEVSYARESPAEALAFYDRGLGIIREVLKQGFDSMSEKERLAFLDSMTRHVPVYLSLCFSSRDRIPSAVGRMYDLALWSKGLVVGGVAALRAQVEASGDAEALALLARLTTTRSELATVLGAPPPDPTAWRATVERLESEANDLEKELARRSAAFAERSRVADARWQDVQQALQPGEAAVEFLRFPFHDGKRFTGASRYVALVLTPGTKAAPILVDLGDALVLETHAFSSYATQVRARSLVHEPAGPPAGASLRTALWRPLEDALSGSHRVYVSPDGKLNELSWGALADDAGRLLIETLDVRVLSSTRDLLRPAKAGTGTAAVLLGNPDFDLDDGAPLAQRAGPAPPAGARSRDAHMKAQPLPATAVEVQVLEASFRAHGWTSEVDTGARALESTVKHVHGPRVLHIATHGFFLPDQERSLSSVGRSGDAPSGAEDPMLRSGLLFAGANRALSGAATPPDREDGVLTAYEAAGLNLQGTELVVLSACETGLGEIRNGEGVFGLRRALEVAGAHNVLMSLWAVPDRETQELMGLFYEKWLSGEDKHDALRAAQLEMRQRVRARYGMDLPYYWAAFIMVGR